MVSENTDARVVAANDIWDTLDAETQQRVVQLLATLVGEAVMVWRPTKSKGLHNHVDEQDQIQTPGT